MITVQRLTEQHEQGGQHFTAAFVIVIDKHESMEMFKQLVQRATNLWPDAPPEIKEFADLITNEGKILQDYRGQDTSRKAKILCDHHWLWDNNQALYECARCHELKI